MANEIPTWWENIEDLENMSLSAPSDAEFLTPPQEQSVTEMDRRSFLKVMGAGLLFATAACYRRPVEKVIPYVNRPEEVTPGVANYYASTCGECSAACGLLVKTREGRPIKLDGNDLHPLNQGALCARGQASVLNLYDPDRLQKPMRNVQGLFLESSWADLDKNVKIALQKIQASGKKLLIWTKSGLGPSTLELIKQVPNALHLAFDPISYEEISLAQQLSYGQALVPHYKFSQAELVLSFGADFLGTWLSPVEFSKEFAALKKPENKKNFKLVSFESVLTLTGTNANDYHPIQAGCELSILLALAHTLIEKGRSAYANNSSLKSFLQNYSAQKVETCSGISASVIEKLADELWEKKSKSLVLGSAPHSSEAVLTQVAVNLLNSILENDGVTVDYNRPALVGQSSFADLKQILSDLKESKIGGVVFYGVNPVYSLPKELGLADLISKLDLSVSVSTHADETASLCSYIATASHSLEAWFDASPLPGLLTVGQPTVSPLYDSRSFQDSLLSWVENKEVKNWHEYLVKNWEKSYHPQYGAGKSFKKFWEDTLQQGGVGFEDYVKMKADRSAARTFKVESLSGLTSLKMPEQNVSLSLYSSLALSDGSAANNAWLQELPDPLSKITWENYLVVSSSYAHEQKIKSGQIVKINQGSETLELPVHIQPKTHSKSMALAVGYGREKAGRVGNKVGVNAFKLQKLSENQILWSLPNFEKSISTTSKIVSLAMTQGRHTAGIQTTKDRPIIQEVEAKEYQEALEKGEKAHHHEHPNLWQDHEYNGYKWGMSIDVNACFGCNACMISCQAENNTAVVGKEQVIKGRSMHWIRIDRYYKSSKDKGIADEDYRAAENPDVAYQPMLCQHCENAPCETVCPVIATVHNEDGLNQMVYNRCVGTRYCANNCPYKVRRFNFFDYFKDVEEPVSLVLNPDISTRSRGVMEKCSFCMHRIRDEKDKAKAKGEKVKEGAIKTACQQACPADAIVFGDLNDAESQVLKNYESHRSYQVLDDLNVKPRITYLKKVIA